MASPEDPGGLSVDDLGAEQLGALARDAISALALRGDQEAFSQLLALSAHTGQCVGEAARRLAAASSWTQVADLTGVTKQAVWERWRG